jgi:hypothetical protein
LVLSETGLYSLSPPWGATRGTILKFQHRKIAVPSANPR